MLKEVADGPRTASEGNQGPCAHQGAAARPDAQADPRGLDGHADEPQDAGFVQEEFESLTEAVRAAMERLGADEAEIVSPSDPRP